MTTAAAASEDVSAEPSSGEGSPEASSSKAQPPDAGVDRAPERRVSEQVEAGAIAESTQLEAVAALPQVLKILGSVIAPTTLLTALLFYFGLLHVTGFFRYLGVNYTVFDLTVQDYLIRSADGLFVPLTVVAATALLVLWVHRLLLNALSAGTRLIMLRVLTPFAAITGLVLVSMAMTAIFGDTAAFAAHPEAGGLSLASGVSLLAYAARLLRLLPAKRRPERARWQTAGAVAVAEWGAIFVLVSVGLFWAVGSYALGVGTSRGQDMEAALSGWPDAVREVSHFLWFAMRPPRARRAVG